MDQHTESMMDTREIRITVSTDAGISDGIVIGIRRLSEMTEDELPQDNMWVITQEDDDGTV